jgi:hypothetical protein
MKKKVEYMRSVEAEGKKKINEKVWKMHRNTLWES